MRGANLLPWALVLLDLEAGAHLLSLCAPGIGGMMKVLAALFLRGPQEFTLCTGNLRRAINYETSR